MPVPKKVRRGMPEEQLTFGWAQGAPPYTGQLLPRAATLAGRLERLRQRGIRLGTSSWKYPGWLGQVYHPSRYMVRGRFSASKFNDECLGEYARVFPTVCGDFAFYQFPTAEMWERMFSQLPPGFNFALKAPEDVTVEHFPKLPRYGQRAGLSNAHFMDASMTVDRLLTPLEPHRDRLGPIIFEFSTIHAGPLSEPKQFVAALDNFLGKLPVERFPLSVEVRNREFLGEPDYFACLHSHRVAHVLNSWTRMPPIDKQMRLPGAFTAQHVPARLLLRPGRSYQQAVEQFSPYEKVQDPYPEGRAALAQLMANLPSGHALYVFVNNRFEGNATETIEATLRDPAVQDLLK